MNFTPDTIYALTKGFSQLFEKGYNSDTIPVLWQDKSEDVPTPGTEINVYGWLAEMPMFRKWVGPRMAKRLAARTYQIKNDEYEFSYAVGVTDIKYDKFGIYNAHASRAGLAARLWRDQMLTVVQLAGNTVKCYDGQFFYDTDHPEDPEDSASATWTNSFTARPPTPANIAFVYDAMASIKGADGELLMAPPNVIEFGPGLRDQVMNSLQADLIAQIVKNVAATENVAAAAVSNNIKSLNLMPMLNTRLPATVWFMHHTQIMKPFIVQTESPPSGLEARVNPLDPHVWDLNEFLFGSKATGGAGYALPHLSARVATT
jgi:phage major head subunit gpT-like protein